MPSDAAQGEIAGLELMACRVRAAESTEDRRRNLDCEPLQRTWCGPSI